MAYYLDPSTASGYLWQSQNWPYQYTASCGVESENPKSWPFRVPTGNSGSDEGSYSDTQASFSTINGNFHISFYLAVKAIVDDSGAEFNPIEIFTTKDSGWMSDREGRIGPSLWVRRSTLSANKLAICVMYDYPTDDGNFPYYFTDDLETTMSLYMPPGSYSKTTIENGWHHIVVDVTPSDSVAAMYVNGRLISPVFKSTGSVASKIDAINFGNQWAQYRGGEFYIDQVYIEDGLYAWPTGSITGSESQPNFSFTRSSIKNTDSRGWTLINGDGYTTISFIPTELTKNMNPRINEFRIPGKVGDLVQFCGYGNEDLNLVGFVKNYTSSAMLYNDLDSFSTRSDHTLYTIENNELIKYSGSFNLTQAPTFDGKTKLSRLGIAFKPKSTPENLIRRHFGVTVSDVFTADGALYYYEGNGDLGLLEDVITMSSELYYIETPAGVEPVLASDIYTATLDLYITTDSLNMLSVSIDDVFPLSEYSNFNVIFPNIISDSSQFLFGASENLSILVGVSNVLNTSDIITISDNLYITTLSYSMLTRTINEIATASENLYKSTDASGNSIFGLTDIYSSSEKLRVVIEYV